MAETIVNLNDFTKDKLIEVVVRFKKKLDKAKEQIEKLEYENAAYRATDPHRGEEQ